MRHKTTPGIISQIARREIARGKQKTSQDTPTVYPTFVGGSSVPPSTDDTSYDALATHNSDQAAHGGVQAEVAAARSMYPSLLAHLQALTGIPTGVIVMWSGALNAVPTGWALCNGENGTPDLRDRFILGAGHDFAVGATGGERSHTLTVGELASHSHTATNVSATATTPFIPNVGGIPGITEIQPGQAGATSTTGSDTPHNNMPPYFALAFIMKV